MLALFRARSFDEAIERGESFIARWPRHPFGHKLIGSALCELRRYEEAKMRLLGALELAPDDGEAWGNLGVALTFLDELDAAKEALLEAQKRAPEDAGLYCRLGFVYHKLGQPPLAAHCLRRSLEIDPDRADAHKILGDCLKELKQPERASAHLERALELAPKMAPAMVNLAVMIDEKGDVDRAISLFEQAIEIDPNAAGVHSNLGNTLTKAGRFEDARACFRRAQTIDPLEHEAFRQLALAKQYRPDDPIIARMLEATDDETLPLLKRVVLGFGLGAVHDQAGEHETAFRCYRKANELFRTTLSFDVHLEAARMQRLMRVCTKEFFADLDSSGASDASPVLVIGMPRCGSTLVEQIISAHPDVAGAGEVLFMQELIDSLPGRLGQPFPEVLPLIGADCAADLAQTYLGKLEARADEEASRITDKLLYNFLYLGLVLRIMPRAKIVHVSRNPLDSCLSMYFLKFATGQRYSYDLRELGQYYRLYQNLMAHWDQVLGDRIYNVRYEDVVTDMEGETRRLLDHCEIPFHPACLEFHKSKRAVATASTQQVRQKLYTRAVSRSKPYEPWLGPLMEALEAPPVAPRTASGELATSEALPFS